jgi:small subunit ribosomal protein S8
MDLLADALSTIKNAERVGKKEVEIKASKLIGNILKIMKEKGYIKNFKFIPEKSGNKFKITLHGKIVDCNVIRPRFSVKKDEFEKWEKRFLPAADIGTLILTTPNGIMDHNQAKKIGVGGKLLCYVY